jgi:hypothetical protein
MYTNGFVNKDVHMPINVNRFDRGRLVSKATITDEGFLKATAIVTRAGIFEYLNSDGSVRRELRHPDDVFNQTSLNSMHMRPITNGHPQQKIVNADNAKALTVGYTGQDVKVDSPFIATNLLITDPQLIKDINDRKKTELSLGYNVDLLDEEGTYQGQPYTHRQTNIRYNHLAVVDKARAGPEAKIHLDASDAIEVDSEHNNYQNLDSFKKEIVDMAEDKNFTSVNIDGLSDQSAPEVAKAYKKSLTKVQELEAKINADKAEVDKLKAEKDDLTQKLDEAKKVNLDELIQQGVKKRVALIEDVKIIMAKKLDEFKFDSMSDRQIKEKTVSEKCPSVEVTKVSEAYLDARFDALAETAREADKKQSANFGNQREKVVTKVDASEQDSAECARQRMIDELTKKTKPANQAAN